MRCPYTHMATQAWIVTHRLNERPMPLRAYATGWQVACNTDSSCCSRAMTGCRPSCRRRAPPAREARSSASPRSSCRTPPRSCASATTMTAGHDPAQAGRDLAHLQAETLHATAEYFPYLGSARQVVPVSLRRIVVPWRLMDQRAQDRAVCHEGRQQDGRRAPRLHAVEQSGWRRPRAPAAGATAGPRRRC